MMCRCWWHLYTALIGSDTGAPWRMRFTSWTRSGESHGSGLSHTDAGFCTCVWSCSFHFVSLQKSQPWCSNWEHLRLGPTWTVLWTECGLLDSLLELNKKTPPPSHLEFWNLGLKLLHILISLQDQTYANCCTACLCCSSTWVTKYKCY